jgi:hypothetical protein
MASIKTEEEIEIFKQITFVYSVAEKLSAASLALMKSAKTEKHVDRAHRVASDAEEVAKIASIIKSQIRKLSEKEHSYVEALDFQIESHLPQNVSDKNWALCCAAIDSFAEERKSENDDSSPLLRHEGAAEPVQQPVEQAVQQPVEESTAIPREVPSSPTPWSGSRMGMMQAGRQHIPSSTSLELVCAQTGWATFDEEPRSPRTFHREQLDEVRGPHRAYNGQEGEVVDGEWVPEE